jgi:predicted  nucleic acid-binding Zn-ribbon protein
MASVKEFSVQEKLTALTTLQKIDSSIDNINKLRGELPIEVKDLEDEIEGLNTRINLVESEIKSINDFSAQKLQLQKDSAELLKKYEKQQQNVKNSREFEAINKEIELQELEIQACDKHMRDAKVEVDEREAQKATTLSKISDKQDVLTQKQKELSKIVAETEKDEAELQKKREKAVVEIEERLLQAYNRIRNNYKNGLAVVAVERDSCGGCYNKIPPQRQSEIRLRKKMTVCEHCGRIMVDNELHESIHV